MTDDLDAAFKPLADPHRRLLLDRLRERDGQTLTELHGGLAMTRFGVMKHLTVLEEAGLVSSRKVGRERFHYLNPVPIRRLYDRWVSRYAEPWTRTLTGLKDALEEESVAQTQPRTPVDEAVTPPAHVYRVFIRTTPERLWQALTDGELTRHYYFGSRAESDWRPGSPYAYRTPDGIGLIEGEVLEADPPRRLVTTFRPAWGPETDGAPTTTVRWEIEPVGAACQLTVVHEGLDIGTPLGRGMNDGWARILSGLKTFLETGDPLVIGG
ncbi:MAG: Transcriptional regulator, ArsR family [uncultured Thermomicrobiales bacterium]|uniref:Transcriptional regulator, ArsR family n=1 Tax=uncultured Thermomicrobiales bacterium TaxID=1645740 RepID=A0A6J4VGL7_9BACT|nr:MAG: Transcriptional regulator, ArsR family [uncultured Thermomicrobiales bacterium]